MKLVEANYLCWRSLQHWVECEAVILTRNETGRLEPEENIIEVRQWDTEQAMGNMGGTGLCREDGADFYCEQVVTLNIVNMKNVWEDSNEGLVWWQKSDGVPHCRQTEFITFQKGKKRSEESPIS